MKLEFDLSVSDGYKSKSQIARVLTENWVASNVYCPSCGNEKLDAFVNNAPVADFYCKKCNSEYELKSKKDYFTKKIVDGAYDSMVSRINSENNPHFFFLNYLQASLEVVNFLVIPKYYFIDDVIEKRKPLSLNARRAGWVGCNILLGSIPESGKIFFIKDSKAYDRSIVIQNWLKTMFLSEQGKESRGWTIEIMKILDKIKKTQFNLSDIYLFQSELKNKFPNNNFIKDKIRQQLQVLRDKGFLEFRGDGNYSKLA